MASDLNTVLTDGEYGDGAFYFSDGLRIREIAGRSGTDTVTGADTAQRTWRVYGTGDPQRAKRAIIDSEDLLINEYDGLNIESLAHDQGPSFDSWDFTASYNANVPRPSGFTISIDTGGAQILQTSSYAQTRYAIGGGGAAPDFRNSIDVQDGRPQGVQRIIPSLKINVRAKIAAAYVESPVKYAKILAGLTGTVNSTPMFGGEFAAGELLFTGASGDIVSEEPQLTFTFLASANEPELSIGGITGIVKNGHDYIWFLFDTAKDSSTGLLVSQPRAAYVDRVYGEADHGLLRIGEPPPPE